MYMYMRIYDKIIIFFENDFRKKIAELPMFCTVTPPPPIWNKRMKKNHNNYYLYYTAYSNIPGVSLQWRFIETLKRRLTLKHFATK